MALSFYSAIQHKLKKTTNRGSKKNMIKIHSKKPNLCACLKTKNIVQKTDV